MRIGIDARELCGRSTGVGRYLNGLLHEWAQDDKARGHEFVLYAHQPIAAPLDHRRFATRVVAGRGGTRWEQQQLLPAVRRDHLDVFFAPGYTAPLFGRLPLVVAIHDVSFAAHPEWFGAREGLRRRLVTRRAATQAQAITTLSEFSKHELIDLLGVPAGKIHIIRPGVVQPALARDHHDAHMIRRAPTVLYVGSIFNRRHVPDLIRAFAHLARRHAEISLDIVGDDRSFPKQDIDAAIARERMNPRIRWHQYVTDVDLAGLYSTTTAFAFLSEYEGLGLTPLEALSCGVPSVLLDTPIARESCGDAALYVPKDNIQATADALSDLLFDDDVRRPLLSAAAGVLARYNWPQAARETLHVLEGAVA